MKIVVLDGYTENPGDLSWSGFEGLGEFTVYDRGSETDKEGEAIARIGDAEIVITNKHTDHKAGTGQLPVYSLYWRIGYRLQCGGLYLRG